LALLLDSKEWKVPDTIVVQFHRNFFDKNAISLNQEEKRRLRTAISVLQRSTHKYFGDPKNPLLLSVAASTWPCEHPFPILPNVGLTRSLLKNICRKSNPGSILYQECYARFLVDLGQAIQLSQGQLKEEDAFEKAVLEILPQGFGVHEDDQREEHLPALIDRLLSIWNAQSIPLPSNPYAALFLALETLLALDTPRHVREDSSGIQFLLQTMVLGNKNHGSGSGVFLTRHPGTGRASDHGLLGRVVVGNQGLELFTGVDEGSPLETLAQSKHRPWKSLYAQLKKCRDRLEKQLPGVSLVEFVFEENHEKSSSLFITGLLKVSPSPSAEPIVAQALVDHRIISKEKAILLITPNRFREQTIPSIPRDVRSRSMLIGKGIGASSGAATGEVAFSLRQAILESESGKDVILIHPDAPPGLHTALRSCVGLLTSTGWEGSPASLSCVKWGIPCVVGSQDLEFGHDAAGEFCNLGGCTLREGDLITLDGDRGEIFAGRVEKRMPVKLSQAATHILQWAKFCSPLEIRVNSNDVDLASDPWVDGIGVLGTEHMFFKGSLDIAQDLFFGRDGIRRKRAMSTLYESSYSDFIRIFKKTNKKSVMIRLLDAPYHDFLPYGSEMEREKNPLLGHHGIRLCLTNSEILQMQTRAIFQASRAWNKKGKGPLPEIMLPLVSFRSEIVTAKRIICEVAIETKRDTHSWPRYGLGLLVETPAAALQGEAFVRALLEPCENRPASGQPKYFFAALDVHLLTQFILAMGSAESDAFLSHYLDKGLLRSNPMREVPGVVERLIRQFISDARDVEKNLPIYLVSNEATTDWAVQLACELGLKGICLDPRTVTGAVLLSGQLASGS